MTAPMYYSELGLFEFQELGVAEAYLRGNALAVWDTGIGKSHLGMASTTMLFEDDLIDLLIVVCESNKLDEWIADFLKFTTIVPTLYHGSLRHEHLTDTLAALGVIQPEFVEAGDAQVPGTGIGPHRHVVLVTTYDTLRRDVATFIIPPGKVRKIIEPGPLMPLIAGLRTYFIFDEITRLKNRTSTTYKAISYAIECQREWGARTLGLTATPMSTSPEDVYNICRLLDPSKVPPPGKFEKYFTYGPDGNGRLRFKKSRLPEFYSLLRPLLMRKRKSDPDVIEQFPKQVEESKAITMGDAQAEVYSAVAEWATELNHSQLGVHFMLLRQIAAYPEAVVRSVELAESNSEPPSQLGARLVKVWGKADLCAIPSAKAQWLVEYLKLLVLGQREKVVVFTFFGPSVGPLLARDLRNAHIKVYSHHPPLSPVERAANKKAFREDTVPCVLMSSDAGSRGMNLPEASYVVHYEMPLTFATYRQRSDRNHRIDSQLPSVTSMALILRDTVEEDIAVTCMDRNADQDIIVGDYLNADQQHILAEERRQMLKISREKR